MKMRKAISIAAIMATVLLAACKKDNNNNNNTNDNDRMFVKQAAVSNQAEIQLGQLAVNKASNDSVRAFGQFMVAEHTTAQSDLKTVGNNIGVAVTDSIDATHAALMQQLMGLSERAFDSVYIHSQVLDHQNTQALFQNEQSGGSNQTVKDYANKYLPHIQMHLQMADSLSRRY